MSKLAAHHTEKCKRCKHGRAAHVGNGTCRMKHCKCQVFE